MTATMMPPGANSASNNYDLTEIWEDLKQGIQEIYDKREEISATRCTELKT